MPSSFYFSAVVFVKKKPLSIELSIYLYLSLFSLSLLRKYAAAYLISKLYNSVNPSSPNPVVMITLKEMMQPQ